MTRIDAIDISDIAADIGVMVQRAYVLSNDLREGSFDETIENPNDAWLNVLTYRERDMTKIELVRDLLYDATKAFLYLQSALCGDSSEINKNYEMAEIMDRYDCNKKLAELLYREKHNREVGQIGKGSKAIN
jgi:neutral trehalase